MIVYNKNNKPLNLIIIHPDNTNFFMFILNNYNYANLTISIINDCVKIEALETSEYRVGNATLLLNEMFKYLYVKMYKQQINVIKYIKGDLIKSDKLKGNWNMSLPFYQKYCDTVFVSPKRKLTLSFWDLNNNKYSNYLDFSKNVNEGYFIIAIS